MGIVTVGYTLLLMEYFFSVWMLALFLGIILLAYPWSFYVRARFEKYLVERGEFTGAAGEESVGD